MLDELRRLTAAHDQQHLLAFWDRLGPDEQSTLAAQIRSIDFDLLRRLQQSDLKTDDWSSIAARALSPPAVRLNSPSPYPKVEARRRGEDALRAGQVGAVLVAGGQGTRLGFEHPKGMYPIGPVSRATLFQILFEKLSAVGRRYGVRIPLFLMTSAATHDETLQFLAKHDRFGLAADDLFVFCQGMMPAVDLQSGRVLLSAPHEIALSPDGHGGLVAALAKNQIDHTIRRRGLRQLFYFQVDNPLAAVCDPQFLGYHLAARSQVSTQVVAKQDPTEKVGVVAEVDKRTQIIEYSDLPATDAERRRADGSLELWAGNIAVHVFDVDFLLNAGGTDQGLPFHVARKKVPYVDASGKSIKPETENALKFERFIFDLLPAAERTLVVEVDPAEAFAPVKNGPGANRDSPEIVERAMVELHTRWLRAAGAEVAAGVPIEISPRFALDADAVKEKVKPGTKLTSATYLCD